ncbi:flagellar filament outsheath protein [Borrelia sp. BU AG58]|uniref:flagellar filament outsheath protein n=1 Tax=Borrelia sp. BU AG58 TaxID=2887345 RepID=UPI001E616541|nr:flagellar filament outsheath protein [Borrelia sp. BU AG58]UER67815.1 flagellar filament outsheath protein [Borrelia sp. BU AG58]
MLGILVRCRSFYFRRLNLKKGGWSVFVFCLFLFLSFFYSSCMIFLNYDNIFFRKVFYFYSDRELISDLRYLRERKTLKENLDFLVKDFLLGNSKGFSLLLDTRTARFLHSFMGDGVYFVNISKEFYDSLGSGYYGSGKLGVGLFIKSLKETIDFNYPGCVGELVVFIEGYVLNDGSDDSSDLGVVLLGNN